MSFPSSGFVGVLWKGDPQKEPPQDNRHDNQRRQEGHNYEQHCISHAVSFACLCRGESSSVSPPRSVASDDPRMRLQTRLLLTGRIRVGVKMRGCRLGQRRPRVSPLLAVSRRLLLCSDITPRDARSHAGLSVQVGVSGREPLCENGREVPCLLHCPAGTVLGRAQAFLPESAADEDGVNSSTFLSDVRSSPFPGHSPSSGRR